MARATLMTLAVSLCAYLLGLLLGGGGAALKISPYRALRIIADIYTTVVRGVPELLILYLLFFGSSSFIMLIARGAFGYDGYIELNAFTIGVIAVGFVAGAYATEVIRGAYLSVPRGQIEAARAFGMSRSLMLRRILLPQVLRFALPGLGNVWQLTLKDTALISVTGLVEIMRQSAIASGSTREPFTFYLLAALLYLLLTSVSNFGFRRAERWSSRGIKNADGGVGR